MDADALVAAGVYDPDAPEAEERLALLRWLLDEGVSLDQIVDAQRRGSLYRAGLDALLWPEGGGLTIGDVARESGLPEATVRRARRLIGLADPGDERVCHRGEVELFRALGAAMQMFGEQPALEFTRVLGTATAAMAEAAVSMFAVSVAEQLREEGVAPVEYAKRVREATMAFTTARFVIDLMMRLQFDEAVDRLTGAWDRTDDDVPRDELDFTVAFVDLAESTQLTVSTSAGDYAAAIRDFEGHAADAAAQHGARLVKLIGDSAMLAGRDPGHVADATVELVEVVTADDRFRGAHAGIASGRVIARAGDYLGPPVNLAARLTEASATGEILCDETTSRALPDRIVPAGVRDVQGLEGTQAVWAINRAGVRSGSRFPNADGDAREPPVS
jgi:adenylate cyclase